MPSGGLTNLRRCPRLSLCFGVCSDVEWLRFPITAFAKPLKHLLIQQQGPSKAIVSITTTITTTSAAATVVLLNGTSADVAGAGVCEAPLLATLCSGSALGAFSVTGPGCTVTGDRPCGSGDGAMWPGCATENSVGAFVLAQPSYRRDAAAGELETEDPDPHEEDEVGCAAETYSDST